MRQGNHPPALLMAFASVATLVFVTLTGCGTVEELSGAHPTLTGGDATRGKERIRYYGCASCHTIKGIDGANALVGPPLDRIGNRSYVAGVMINSPENMIRWIQDPPGVNPQTAMPNVGVTEQDARDIASYLYTLR